MFKTEQADENLQKIVEELELSEIPADEDQSYEVDRIEAESDESMPEQDDRNPSAPSQRPGIIPELPVSNPSPGASLPQGLVIPQNEDQEEIYQFDLEDSPERRYDQANEPRQIFIPPTRLQRLRLPQGLRIEQPESPTSLRGLAGRSPTLQLIRILESNLELGD